MFELTLAAFSISVSRMFISYLDGSGDMMLIYPKHHQFETPLECFHLSEELRLWVIPFCIETEKIITDELIGRFSFLSQA